jgi:putative PIN family toxin of toxin-antitoxin system
VRIVLDSSVLIAAAITRAGVCAKVLEDVLMYHELVLSDFVLDEVERKLRSKFRFADADVRGLLRFLRQHSEAIEPAPVPASVCRDPKDRPILGTAVAGGAALLVTGDQDLLSIGDYEGIAIRRPAEFWLLTTG